jgi:hypothetical protein
VPWFTADIPSREHRTSICRNRHNVLPKRFEQRSDDGIIAALREAAGG